MFIIFALLLLCFVDSVYSTNQTRRIAFDLDQQTRANSWGAKRARTVRYEVHPNDEIAPVHNQSGSKCEICRPNCSHWDSLSKNQRHSESVKWYYKNQTKEQKKARLKYHNTYYRKWYANLSKDKKAELLDKIRSKRQEKTKGMTVEAKQAIRIRDRTRDTQTRQNRLAKMTAEEKRRWYKQNNDYSRKPSKKSQSP